MRKSLVAALVVVAALAGASPAAAAGFFAGGTFPGVGGDITYELRACQGRLGTYQLKWQHVGGWSGGTTKEWTFTAQQTTVPISWSYPVTLPGMNVTYTYSGNVTLGGTAEAPTVSFDPATGTVVTPVISVPYSLAPLVTLRPATAAECPAAAPSACVVPNLKRKTLAAAKKALLKANCRLGKVTKRRSTKVGRGRVISQSPKAGARRAARAKVSVVLSRGR